MRSTGPFAVDLLELGEVTARPVSRHSSDYIRWVQEALNQVLGMRLVVDGRKGPATRSAIRSFQQQRGLTVDGVVGPRTEQALVATGTPRPRAAALPAAVAAFRAGFGTTPVFLRAGGTIPAVSVLETVLELPPLLMGFGLPADGIHGPNERLHLPTFWHGVETCIWLLAELGHHVEHEP